ncbi:MAG TPA: PLP-dependent aminotransferase family protein [Actinophytocola sp.]|uniref:MocR-like transcription factor YczR n=1 Tax=Actinophytocola sp. TaxID=1872138 RepID=UPI002DDCC61D|nr:PLP-dependent aminotransferase family protein [Actinophytocola sp.]HEV2779844.1 PLP-dependent aminotransferase family protein [Actinophytocola sp.]
MQPRVSSGGQITGHRLARLLGAWRRHGSRRGSADLAAGIRMLVLDGRLPPGTGLPAEREVAAALAVSRTMVASAWEQLRAEGLVVSRRGAGSWTTLPAGAASAPTRDPFDAGDLIDLARAVPGALPGIAAAVEAAQPRLAAELAHHGYYELGLPVLRERIAARFTERGLPTTAAEVLITNGSHNVLAIALRMLAGPGDRVLIEQPTYPNSIDAIRAANALPVPVAMTDDGWDLDGIEAALRQAAPRLAFLIVDFHNPTGLRLDAEGRARLAAALRRTRTPAVVDETHVELDLDGDPADGPPPLAAFTPEWVIAAGSASKSHWGGLRLGWVRAPAEVITRLAVARRSIDLGSPVFEQLVLAELLAGPADAMRERRADLAGRRDVLVDAMRTHCPEWTFRVPGGGLSLWCRLPAPVGTRIAVTAQNFGVWVVPGPRFAAHAGLERWLRLPYTQPPEVLVDGVRRLSNAAASVLDRDVPLVGNALTGPVT